MPIEYRFKPGPGQKYCLEMIGEKEPGKEIVAEIKRIQDGPLQLTIYDYDGSKTTECSCIGDAIIVLADRFAYNLVELAAW